jgi:alcohol dehydrogenase (cytochrome c)
MWPGTQYRGANLVTSKTDRTLNRLNKCIKHRQKTLAQYLLIPADIACLCGAVRNAQASRTKKFLGRTEMRPSNIRHSSRIAAYSIAALASVMAASVNAQDSEPPLGVDTLEATFKWRPNYVSDDMLKNAHLDANNWLSYGKGYDATRYSQLSQINRDNVKKLVPKWNLSFGVNDPQESQVLAVNGTLYVTSSQNKVFAVEGSTGRILWKYEHPLPGDIGPYLCCEAVNRGVAVYKDKVFMETLDTQVVALNSWNGKEEWKVKLGDYTSGDIYTSVPLIADGKVIVGNSGGDLGGNVGRITALDPDTGKKIWEQFTGPRSADDPLAKTWGGGWEHGGGSAWQTGSYEPETKTLFWAAGNPAPDFDRHSRPGDNLYSDSTLAMNVETGEIKYHFQYTPNDAWDYSGNNEAILINDEKGRKVWLHGDRNGHLYSIDRTNGKCNWVLPIARVNWVKSWGENCRPIVNPDKIPVKDHLVTDIAPVLDGGKEWHPATYSPKTKMIYIPFIDSSMNIQLKDQKFERGKWFLRSKVLSVNPYTGGLKAFNATTGELIWTKPQSYPATSGLISTAGGLVFYGDAEGYFGAVRDDTGEELWRFNVGTGIHGNPSTFTVDGKQMVAVVYGPGGGSLWPLTYPEFFKTHNRGGGVMVFALQD